MGWTDRSPHFEWYPTSGHPRGGGTNVERSWGESGWTLQGAPNPPRGPPRPPLCSPTTAEEPCHSRRGRPWVPGQRVSVEVGSVVCLGPGPPSTPPRGASREPSDRIQKDSESKGTPVAPQDPGTEVVLRRDLTGRDEDAAGRVHLWGYLRPPPPRALALAPTPSCGKTLDVGGGVGHSAKEEKVPFTVLNRQTLWGLKSLGSTSSDGTSPSGVCDVSSFPRDVEVRRGCEPSFPHPGRPGPPETLRTSRSRGSDPPPDPGTYLSPR